MPLCLSTRLADLPSSPLDIPPPNFFVATCHQDEGEVQCHTFTVLYYCGSKRSWMATEMAGWAWWVSGARGSRRCGVDGLFGGELSLGALSQPVITHHLCRKFPVRLNCHAIVLVQNIEIDRDAVICGQLRIYSIIGRALHIFIFVSSAARPIPLRNRHQTPDTAGHHHQEFDTKPVPS